MLAQLQFEDQEAVLGSVTAPEPDLLKCADRREVVGVCQGRHGGDKALPFDFRQREPEHRPADTAPAR